MPFGEKMIWKKEAKRTKNIGEKNIYKFWGFDLVSVVAAACLAKVHTCVPSMIFFYLFKGSEMELALCCGYSYFIGDRYVPSYEYMYLARYSTYIRTFF